MDAANSSTALIANATATGTAETFDLITDPGGTVSLRAHSDGQYVTAPNAGAGSLIADQSSSRTNETFDLIHNADGSISLRAHADNAIVTAENAGASALIANRTVVGPWEEFDEPGRPESTRRGSGLVWSYTTRRRRSAAPQQ